MLDEELSTSNDADFSDIFPTPDVGSSDLDELVTVVGKDDSSPAEEQPVPVVKKKKGRPKKEEAKSVEAVPVKRGRGRPPKKVVEQTVEENEEDETPVVVEEKKTRSKRVSVDDFTPDVLNGVFENYSLKPAAEIAQEFGIQEKHVHKIIERLTELFEMAISTGDLTQEDYDKEIAPKVIEFQKPKDNFEAFVKTKVKSIKK